MTEDFTLKQKWSHCYPGSENTSLAVMSLILFRHHGNRKRLCKKTESAPGKLCWSIHPCWRHPALLEASTPVGGRPSAVVGVTQRWQLSVPAALSTSPPLSPPLTESPAFQLPQHTGWHSWAPLYFVHMFLSLFTNSLVSISKG